MKPAERPPNLQVEDDRGVAVVRFLDEELSEVYGETDDVRRIRDQLYGLVEDGGYTRILLDCRRVRYMATYMIGVLAGLKRRLVVAGGTLALFGLNELPYRALELTGLIRIFSIYPDEPTAVAALQREV